MGEVSDYLDSVDGRTRDVLTHVYSLAREVVPDAEEGRSYGMPALLHRGQGLVATLRTRQHLSLYPFSGTVVAAMAEDLVGFATTKGSVHYSVEQPLPDDVVRRLVRARREEIDARLGRDA